MREPISVSSRLCSSVKRPGSWRLQIEHADDSVLDDQRNRHSERTSATSEMYSGASDVIDQNGFAPLRRQSGYALANFDLHPLGDFARISHLKTDAQFLGFLIQQEDGEDLVVNDFAHQFRHAAQGGVQVERGVDHVRHLEQKGSTFNCDPIGSQKCPRLSFMITAGPPQR